MNTKDTLKDRPLKTIIKHHNFQELTHYHARKPPQTDQNKIKTMKSLIGSGYV